jgi:hypothetical protein
MSETRDHVLISIVRGREFRLLRLIDLRINAD